MRCARSYAPLLLITLFAACGSSESGGEASQSDNAAVGVVPIRNLAALESAASWVGDIPCADCEAIRTTVTLYPDGTFRSEGIYLKTKGAGDTIFTDIGRWTHIDSATRLRLSGASGAPARFAVEPDGSLRMLDMDGQPINSKRNYQLSGTVAPVVITHPARLVGAFTYMADAAVLVECGSGLQFPVDMSADYPALEAAYLKTGKAGKPVVVRLKAHLADRPAMEGDGTTLSLVVDSMDHIDAEDGCAALRTQDRIAAGPWRLVALASDSTTLRIPADTKAVLAWRRSDGQLVGNSGCNCFSAPAVMRGTTLVGGTAVGTKMFCDGSMDVEGGFLALIATGGALRVHEDTLIWSQGPRDAARFVRQ